MARQTMAYYIWIILFSASAALADNQRLFDPELPSTPAKSKISDDTMKRLMYFQKLHEKLNRKLKENAEKREVMKMELEKILEESKSLEA